MIAVDTNVLVYVHQAHLPQHARARARVTALAEGDEPWAIPVFCLTEFARVISHPRLFDSPFSAEETCEAISRLLESPTVRLLTPGERFVELFQVAIRESGASGNLIFDAQIVAVCRETGARALVTEDRDFARFSGFVTERL